MPMPCFPDKSLSARSGFACQHGASRLVSISAFAHVSRPTGAGLTSVRSEGNPPFKLLAALDPYSDANAPESAPLSESVFHVAQIALGQIFGPGREEREPRRRRACLGSVADLDPFRRRAAPYHLTHELSNLVRRHPHSICSSHSSRERQDVVHPCARKRRDVNYLRLQVGEAG